MAWMILGLLLFLGVHALRMLAANWRDRVIERWGVGPWKGVYSLIALAGLALIVWGFSRARLQPRVLYAPAASLRHLNALFTLAAFVLLVAAYVPRNHFKRLVGHPMLAAVLLWALGHLLATGMLHDTVLFGAFLLWSAADYVVSRRRDLLRATIYPSGTLAADGVTVLIGLAAWSAFAFWLHTRWIGVNPFG